MTDESALLAAIRAVPEDDDPRLVYADWLDEHAQPKRAEFIRVQCELARRKSRPPRRREAKLLASHHKAIAGPLASRHLRFQFRRGFATGFGHTGIFENAYRGERPTFNYVFRFYPKGVLIWCSLHGAPAEITSWFRLGDRRAGLKVAYRFDPFSTPARLRFVLDRGFTEEYEGTLEGTSLKFEIATRIDGEVSEPTRRGRLRLVRIPDFHSFPE